MSDPGDAATLRGLDGLLGCVRRVVPLADDLTMWIEEGVDPQCPVNRPAMHVAARFGPDPFRGAVRGSVLFSGAGDGARGLSEARLGWLLGQLVRDGVCIEEQSG